MPNNEAAHTNREQNPTAQAAAAPHRQSVLAIYGSGGHGKEVAEVAMAANVREGMWDEIVFVNDFIQEGTVLGLPIRTFAGLCETYAPSEMGFAVGVGEPASRKKLIEKISSAGYGFISVIDPTARVAPGAKIGSGVVVSYDARIGPETVIGDNSCISAFANVSHNCILGENVFVAAHATLAGACTCGENVFVGMGSMVREKSVISSGSVIGMGSVVLGNIPSNKSAYGNPARVQTKDRSGKSIFQ
jgi:sugar O-acyltransferase (sialic acid O-acetyltransferase NeuD family)